MSTTAMWLLLAVVIVVILFGSVLYKRTFTTKELALTGVMAALSLVAYLFFRVPFYGGSSFHLGNTFTALTALLLDGVSGGLAGAIGLALADILAGDPGYAITTFVLKFIIGITCGAVAHKAFKLRDLDKWSEARQHNAAEYRKLFAAAKLEDKVALPQEATYPVRHIYNQFCIRISGGRRDALRAFLQEQGVGCAVYYPLSLHLQNCFRNLGGKPGDYPVSEQVSGEILALPIYPESTTEQREFVVDTIAKFFA